MTGNRPNSWRIGDLLILLLVSLIPRLWFWPPTLVGMDSIGFAVGGLGTWSAHPPGYFGVCFTAWLINHLVGNIKDSLVLMNVAASLVAIAAMYRLSQWIGLSRLWTLLATASYAFSIHLLYNSIVPLSYATEAMFAAVIGSLVFAVLRTKSQGWAILATLVWALSGYFRQTSCFILAPLVAWMVFRAVPWQRWIVHAVLGLVISWSWMATNSYFMSAASGIRSTSSFAGSVWSTQIMMQSSYDTSSLQTTTHVQEGEGSGFHWPGVELLAWVDDRCGTHLLPDWRTHSPLPPNPNRALKLTLNQVAKVSWHLVLSLPALLLVLPAAWIAMRRRPSGSTLPVNPSPNLGWFYAIWISPALALFIFGHMGPPGYLLVFLPAWASALAFILQRISRTPDKLSPIAWAHGVLTGMGLALFSIASPLKSESDSRRQMADLLALQYTGKAVVQGYNIARSTLNKPAEERFPVWTRFTTDKEIVEWWRKSSPDSKALYPPVARDN